MGEHVGEPVGDAVGVQITEPLADQAAEAVSDQAHEQPSQRECQGCDRPLGLDELKCLTCGTYREDVQERMVWWWTIKMTQALILAVLIYLFASGYWGTETSRFGLLASLRSPLFWSIVASIALFAPASMYFGIRLARDTGQRFYKWLG
jgi:hypothetical protein